MERILNSTPVRTTNNFKINDIKVDIPDISFESFDSYKIDGEYTSSIKDNFKSRIGLEYDKYLTKLYGNYMKYPPLDKQVGHHYNKGLSLTEGYKDYIKRNRI